MSSFDGNNIYLVDRRSSKEFAVEIPLECNELSSKLEEITECLRLEFAPIEIWHRISVELHRYGLDRECNKLLGKALEDDLKHQEDWNTTVCTYEGSPEKRINLLNAAAIQAVNSCLNSLNNNDHSDKEQKINVRKAMKYYKLARDIATKFDGTEKYNMVFHFLAGLVTLCKAKHKKEDIAQIMVKTKHDLKKAIQVKEMEDQDYDLENNDNKYKLEREPNFIAILCTATLSYAIGDYEDSLTNYQKLLEMTIDNEDNHHYLGFVQLGIGLSSLKLKEYDIARHAFERAKKIDKNRNDGNYKYVGIKSSIGLALVYLNQHEFIEKDCDELMNKNGGDKNKNKNKDINKKLKSMKKALKEISEAFEYSPNNPQLLVLMANFIGFSFKGTKLIKKWAGTAYDICQKITKLIDREPNEYDILSGLDQKAVLRRNFNIHSGSSAHSSSMDGNDTLSTCIHPLAKCQAEACYVIAKMYHCANDFNEAIKWYYKSVVLSPYFVLSLFGLSQMYIFEKKLDHAKICLERILKINKSKNIKNDSNVLSHYAFVCRNLGDIDIAKENLEKACKLNPNIADLWIDLAEITEQSDPQYSIKKYMTAKSILQQQGKEIPFELYNNIIVLFYKLKDFEKAKKLSQELIEMTKDLYPDDNTGDDKIPYHQVVIQYNYARILDELCEYKKARKIYRQILITQPSFIEATLCNALYLYRSGKYKEAINKFEEAAKKAQQYNEISIQLDAYLYIHRINTQIGKRHDAEKILRQIDEFRKKSSPSLGIQNDEYSELISANYILSYHRNRHNQNYYKRIHESLRRFQQVLVTNQNNIYAVHGIGVVAAESAELNLSKSILSKLRDCFNSKNESSALQCNADMMVNLGHVFSAYQQWDNALKCYEKAKKKLKPHEQGDIPLYIVRTLFAKKDFINAKLKLHQILRFNPTQELYLYNLALIEEEYACDILRKDPNKRTLKEVENVMEMLKNAKRLYKRLDSNKKTYAGIPQEKLKQHLDHIKNELLKNAQKHLDFQREQEERKEKKREQERRKLEKSIEKEKRKQFEKEQEEKRQNERLKQKAREVKQRGRGIVFHVPDSNGRGGGGQSGGTRKRRRKQSSQQGNDDMDNGPPQKRQRQSMANHMDQFGDRDNDDDNDNNDNNYNRHNRFNGDDDDEDGDIDMLNEEQSQKKKLKKNKKKKKKKNKGDIDETKWAEMEIKIEDIVRNSDLNTLTNRQVKTKLSEFFPNVNIKAYKSRIKEKINEVAKQLQEMSQE